jgi:hypothetical protein
MGTDATFIIQILNPGGNYINPYPWAKIEMRRDHTLFELLAGIRSEDPTNAVIPIHKIEHPVVGEAYTASLSELALVEKCYQEKTGKSHLELRAIIAALDALSENDDRKARVIYYYI